MNQGKWFLISGIFLVLALVFFFLLYLSYNNFDSFRRYKERLAGQKLATIGQEINFFWNKTESKLEQVEVKKDGSVGAKDELSANADDLNDDGQNEEFVLVQGFLKVYRGKKLIWRSPKEWWVDGYYLADANGDGKKEINLSVWKAGDFGPAKPFWIKKNDQSIRNHFFVMSLVVANVKPLWQSSNLEKPNCEFLFSDIDEDGKQELIVIEGEYNEKYTCQGKYLALWRWNGWGFSNYWRSPAGSFEKMQLSENGLSLSVFGE